MDEPIVARPPSTGYQLQKFARRHKGLVAAVATVFVALVAGIATSTWLAVRARRAEAAAVEARDRAIVAELKIALEWHYAVKPWNEENAMDNAELPYGGGATAALRRGQAAQAK